MTEKKIDIEKVISSAFGKRQRQNFVDVLLEDVCDVHKAELLLGVLQFEEVQAILFNTTNFLSDLAIKIESLLNQNYNDIPDNDAVKTILVSCFRKIVNISSLEVMFFPTRSSQYVDYLKCSKITKSYLTLLQTEPTISLVKKRIKLQAWFICFAST